MCNKKTNCHNVSRRGNYIRITDDYKDKQMKIIKSCYPEYDEKGYCLWIIPDCFIEHLNTNKGKLFVKHEDKGVLELNTLSQMVYQNKRIVQLTSDKKEAFGFPIFADSIEELLKYQVIATEWYAHLFINNQLQLQTYHMEASINLREVLKSKRIVTIHIHTDIYPYEYLKQENLLQDASEGYCCLYDDNNMEILAQKKISKEEITNNVPEFINLKEKVALIEGFQNVAVYKKLSYLYMKKSITCI